MQPERPYLAVFLDLRGQRGVVVGGGPVAAAKVETLMRSGVAVTVVAPKLCAALAQGLDRGALRHDARAFEARDLAGARIAVAATDDRAVNAAVAAAATALGIPVDVADNPALSTFIMPALVDRGPVQVAISTGGASPVLARRLRALVEAAVPPAFGHLAALAAEFRTTVKARIPDMQVRRRFWERIVEGPVARQMLEGRDAEARALFERELEAQGVAPEANPAPARRNPPDNP